MMQSQLFSIAEWYDGEAIGNLLADFVDAHGPLLVAPLANTTDYSPYQILGRFNAQNYWLIEPYTFSGMDSIGAIYLPNHYIMQGVNTVGVVSKLGQGSSVDSGAARIADFADGTPMVAAKENGLGRRVDLGFPIVTSNYIPGFGFDTTSDAGQLIINSLKWLSGGGSHWISLDPWSGLIPSNDSVEINLAFNANVLPGGDYDGNIIIRTSDTDEAGIIVPASLHVMDGPILNISRDTLEFGDVYVGYSRAETLFIHNYGSSILEISKLSTDNSDYVAIMDTLVVAAGGSRPIQVSFAPSAASPQTGVLHIECNDPYKPMVDVILQGRGALPPDISITPDSMNEELYLNGSVTRELTIANNGGSDLPFNLTTKYLDKSRISLSTKSGEEKWSLFGVGPDNSRGAGTVLKMIPSPGHTLGLTFMNGSLWAIVWGNNDNKIVEINPGDGSVRSEFSTGSYYFMELTNDGTSLWATEGEGSWIRKFDTSGRELAAWESPAPSLGLAWHDGSIWICGSSGPTLYRMDTLGNVLETKPFTGGWWGIHDMEWAQSHAPCVLWAADYGGGRIGQFDITSDPTSLCQSFASPVSDLEGIAYDGRYLWISGYFSSWIYMVDDGINESWMSIYSVEGLIPPGDTANVSLTISASHNLPGEHLGEIDIISNDPDDSLITIPVRLNILDAPAISVLKDTLDFGNVFLGNSKTDSIIVINTGTDILNVTGLFTDNPDIDVDTGGFELAPGLRRAVVVTYAPSSEGIMAGKLTMTSNDPNQSEYTVFLSGAGLLPPHIVVGIDSLSAALLTGESATRKFMLTNSGESNLQLNIAVNYTYREGVRISIPSNSDQNNIPSSRKLGFTGSNSTSVAASNQMRRDSEGGADTVTSARNNGPAVLKNFKGAGSVIRTIPAPGATLGLTFFDGSLWAVVETGYGGEIMRLDPESGEIISKFSTNNSRCMGLTNDGFSLWVSCDQDGTIREYSKTGELLKSWVAPTLPKGIAWDGSSLWVCGFSGSPLYRMDTDGNVLETKDLPYGAVEDIQDMEWVPAHDLCELWVADIPSSKISQFNIHGESPSLCQDFASPTGYGIEGMAHDGENLWISGYYSSVIYVVDDAIEERRWLATDIKEVTLPAGDSIEITATFDATGMYGGDYFATLNILSNVPDQPEIDISAHLKVTGAPDIKVSRDTINFDTVYMGASAVDTLIVSNIGTDLLTVTDITSDDANFVADAHDFDLMPGERRAVAVVFTPSTIGDLEGKLSFISNDASTPEVSMVLRGVGLIPPVLTISQDSLDQFLLADSSTTRKLTIKNEGGSDLRFNIAVRYIDNDGTVISTIRCGKGAGEVLRVIPTWANSSGLTYIDGSIWAIVDDWVRNIIVRIDPNNGNTVSQFNLGCTGNMGLTNDGNNLWVTNDNDGKIRKYDRNGTLLGTITPEISPRGIAWGGGSLWICGADNTPFYNIDTNGNTLAIKDPPMGSVNQIVDMEWASKQQPCNLWSTDYYQTKISQFDVLGDQVSECQIISFLGNSVQGIAHDGENLWISPHQKPVIYMVDDGVAELKWLKPGLVEGIVTAGDSMAVFVNISAADMYGGDYFGEMIIGSNDPISAEVIVVAHLNIEGAPNLTIASDSIDFGKLFIGNSKVDSTFVKNAGTDTLMIEDISASSSDFVAESGGIAVAAGERVPLRIRFAPGSEGEIVGSLIVSSNDPDEPTKAINVKGWGVLPPNIEINPDSLEDTLFTGQDGAQALTIRNTGASELAFYINGVEILNGDNVGRARREGIFTSIAGPDSLVKIYNSQNSKTPLSAANIAVLGTNINLLNNVAEYLNSSGRFGTVTAAGIIPEANQMLQYDAILVFSWSEWSDENLVGNRLADFVDSGGNLMIAVAANVWDGMPLVLGERRDITGTYRIHGRFDDEDYWLMKPAYTDQPFCYFMDTVYESQHPIMAGINSVRCSNKLTNSAVVDTSATRLANFHDGTPIIAIKELKKGRRVDVSYAVFDNTIYPPYGIDTSSDADQLVVNAMSWLAYDIDWMTINPKSGRVAPGESVEIMTKFDAESMSGGDYSASLMVYNNVPNESIVNVPVKLHVTGAADIALSKDTLDYGNVFIGYPRIDTLFIKNKGTSLLTVSDIVSDFSEFSPSITAFDLAPNESKPVAITFAPGSVASYGGKLTIKCNDPDQPEVMVDLLGAGLIAPEISVEPDSLDEVIFTESSIARRLTIRNSGGSDLRFNLELNYSDSAQISVKVQPDIKTSGSPIINKMLVDRAEWNIFAGKTRRDSATGGDTALLGIKPEIRLSNNWNPKSGAILKTIPAPENTLGLTYMDGSLWALARRYPNDKIFQIDPDSGTIISSFDVGAIENFGLTNDGVNIIVCSPSYWVASKYDKDGIFHGSIDLPCAAKGIAWDGSSLWVCGYFDSPVYRLDADGNILETVDFPDGTVGDIQDMEWVPTHDSCKLWVADIGYSKISQFNVLNEPTSLCQDFAFSESGIEGIAHDGHNLWISTYFSTVIYQIDDGIEEASWLAIGQEEGIVPAGGSTEISVTINATGMNGGDYFGEIAVRSNDPDDSVTSIPVRLKVIGASNIVVSKDTVRFGTVFIGYNRTDTVIIANSGTDQLSAILTIDNPDLLLNMTSIELAPSAKETGPGDIHTDQYLRTRP